MKKLRGAAALLVLLWGLMLPVCALGAADGPASEPPAPREITLLFNQVFLTDNILVTEGDALSLETELEDRSQLLNIAVGVTADQQYAADLELESLEHTVDVYTPGAYLVTAKLRLSEEYIQDYFISEEVRTLRFQVTVAAKGSLTMAYGRCCEGFIQYNYASPEESWPALWYVEIPRDAQEVDTASLTWVQGVPEDFYLGMPSAVRVLRASLDENWDYLFQLRGENLSSDIMRLNPATLQSSPLPSTGGNRDGDDAEEPGIGPPLVQTPPPAPGHGNAGSQPQPDAPLVLPVGEAEPTPQPDPASSPAPGLERVEGGTLTISGARLLWLLKQNPETVPFGWNGVSIQLPAAFLKGLGLGDSDMLALSLTQEDALAFTISLTAKGEKITKLEEALVRLPAPEPLEGYALTLGGETLGTTVTYEQGCAMFPITQTGHYALCENEAPEDALPPTASVPENGSKESWVQPVLKSYLPAAAALLLGLACAGWLWWRKRRP